MLSQLTHFTDRCVDLSQDAVIGEPAPAVEKGDGGYADWLNDPLFDSMVPRRVRGCLCSSIERVETNFQD